MKIYFDLKHSYYFPQYEPVLNALLQASHLELAFVCYEDVLSELEAYLSQHSTRLSVHRVNNEVDALQVYNAHTPNWVIFGDNSAMLDKLAPCIKTALMQHGIGPKSCYYTVSKGNFSVRFVEGQYRLKRLQALYPDKIFIDTGYAKLDPIFNGSYTLNIEALGLDPQKPTLLYAPTYYPSSIECLPNDFPHSLGDYNLIIKPHQFSLSKAKYAAQRKRLMQWQNFDNVYLVPSNEVNIAPYLALSDLLFSEASSTLFEFAVLDKPVVWCDFMKLRWSYRGIFHFRWKKRIDQDIHQWAHIAAHARTVSELKATIETQLRHPNAYQAARLECRELLAGKLDGQCAQRIKHYLMDAL